MSPSPVVPRRAVAVLSLAAAGALFAGCSSSGGASGGGSGQPSGSAADPHKANVTITAAGGCVSDRLDFPAGGVTFDVQNKDATAVSEVELQSGERIVGERENLPPGLGGSFSVTLTAGKYTLYCPGAVKEHTTVSVTGTAKTGADTTTTALLTTGTKQWGQYVTNQVGYLVSTAKALDTALHGTNLTAAQDAYMKSRPYYEKIEPVAESFTIGTGKNQVNLDSNIDARVKDVPPSQFQGFHRIEKGLFQDHSLAGLDTFGDGLVTNVTKLQSLSVGLTYKPFELANGAQDLLEEVASSKITGEEEAYSLIDLLDFQANDEGAEQAFADLAPALQKIDAGLTAEVTSAFAALDKLVDTYRTGTNPSGFKLYNQLTAADKSSLAAAVKAVQEPLSQVASKVANS
jgi:iron uptake system component EfeO